MENKLTKIICSSCKKEFAYQINDMRVPSDKEREYIYCPYCNQVNGSEITTGWITTYKIEDIPND